MAKAKRRGVKPAKGLRGTTGRRFGRSVERGLEAQQAAAPKRGEGLGMTQSEASVDTEMLDDEL